MELDDLKFDLKYISEGYRGICCSDDIMEGHIVIQIPLSKIITK